MTALSEYQRLEATGLWRAAPDAQRVEVIVSIGDATLVITDLQDRALAHWSLPAVARANPGQRPALYFPDGNPGETLELSKSEADVIDAIEKLRATIERRRPHPGRLRLVTFVTVLAGVMALMVWWLPGAMRRHAVNVVPEVKRQEIGAALLTHIQRVTGPPCREAEGGFALTRLGQRLPSANGSGRLLVMRNGVRDTVHLPDGSILINRILVEDYEEPDIVAGYVIAARLRTTLSDPLADLLKHTGLWVSFRLLTTGKVDDETLESYAEYLLVAPSRPLNDDVLLAGFEAWSVRSTPYAYAVDITGEATLALIEADPFAVTAPETAILSDADWLRLQGICGG